MTKTPNPIHRNRILADIIAHIADDLMTAPADDLINSLAAFDDDLLAFADIMIADMRDPFAESDQTAQYSDSDFDLAYALMHSEYSLLADIICALIRTRSARDADFAPR